MHEPSRASSADTSAEHMKNSSKLIAIVGETASGKSGLAIEIAKLYDGEVLSADSRTIYKFMDVGTAKPTAEEMEGVPHYGFDLVEPNETYTAAQFKAYATDVIADIHGRDKLPIMVGGTGLYVDGVLFDYTFGVQSDKNERSQLDNKDVDELATIAQEKGIEVSSETLKNKRHLIRLIERGGETERKNELFYNTLIIGVRMSKTKLRHRIEKRTELMFRKGLRKEYNELSSKYGTNWESFSGIGYREFRDSEGTDTSTSEVKRQIVKNTMGLAKKQRTWFKRNPNIHWVESPEEALELVSKFMDNK